MTCVRTPAAAAPACLILLALAGCVAVTINVTFPQEKIDSAASSIEDLVRDPTVPPADGPTPGPRSDAPAARLASAQDPAPAARIVVRWPTWLGPARAEAQVPDIKTRTPQVMAVIESRRARYREVVSALARGCVGENNQGLLEVPPGDLARVQTGFARAHRERAPAGAWVQDEGGGWSRK